jgi:hypothetical protein
MKTFAPEALAMDRHARLAYPIGRGAGATDQTGGL